MPQFFRRGPNLCAGNAADRIADRGSVMYLAVLLLMRLMPRRAGGDLARMDLVFLLLIAEAATHALGDYKTVTDALIVIATLMAWDYFINAISFRLPLIERLVSAPAVEIVRDGKMLRRNMRREYVTEEELMSYLRLEGLDDLTAVKSARVRKRRQDFRRSPEARIEANPGAVACRKLPASAREFFSAEAFCSSSLESENRRPADPLPLQAFDDLRGPSCRPRTLGRRDSGQP